MKRYTETQVNFDERIVKYIEEKRIKVNEIYEDIQRKTEFLRNVLGYNGLVVERNRPTCPLKDCKPGRISAVARKEYLAAKKRLEEYRRKQRVLNRISGTTLEGTLESFDF